MIRQIHEWNAFGCLALSLVFNSVLIWLVLKRSPREMHVYSRILLHTAFGDLALSLALAITQPVYFTCADDRTVLFLNGPLVRNISSTALQFVCIELAVLAVYFTVFGLCVQFVYRYLILLRNVSISLAHYFAMLLILFSSALVLCVLIFLVGYPPPDNEFIGWHQLPEMMASETDGQPLHVVMASYPGPGWYCITALLLVINLSCYSVITFCGYRMVKYVRESVGHFVRPEVLQLNKELTRSLILLAVMPVLLSSVSMCVSACLLLISASPSTSSTPSGTLSGSPSGSGSPVPLLAQLLSTLAGHWLPVFNPLIYIFTVRPYRRTCCSTFGKVGPSTIIVGGANAGNGAVPIAFVESLPQQIG